MEDFLLLATVLFMISADPGQGRSRPNDAPGGLQVVEVAADTTFLFPDVEGKNLEGRTFLLPRDFEGRVNIVFVAFRREQQTLVDGWMPAAAALAKSHPDLRYYELPVIGTGYRLFRSFIDGGMRSGIPDRAARERTITLYINKTPFRGALGIQSEETIYVFIVNAEGRVLHMLDGAYTDEKGEIVRRAVEKLLD